MGYENLSHTEVNMSLDTKVILLTPGGVRIRGYLLHAEDTISALGDINIVVEHPQCTDDIPHTNDNILAMH